MTRALLDPQSPWLMDLAPMQVGQSPRLGNQGPIGTLTLGLMDLVPTVHRWLRTQVRRLSSCQTPTPEAQGPGTHHTGRSRTQARQPGPQQTCHL